MKRSPGRRRRSEPQRGHASRGPRSVAAEPSGPAALAHHRRLALFGTTAIIGLGMTGMSDSLAGMALVLIGLLGFIVALHRFGRLGKDRG